MCDRSVNSIFGHLQLRDSRTRVPSVLVYVRMYILHQYFGEG